MLMLARLLTALAHGTFFGVGSVVAASLVPVSRKASAIAVMFTGLTLANLLGVPFGAWLGQHFGWRATFWAVTAIGVITSAVIVALVPALIPRAPLPLRAALKAVTRGPVLLGLAMTVFGFAGVFAVFTYIQPLLIQWSGFSDRAVPPILLLFGAGLIAGNLVGGRWADRNLPGALTGSLMLLAATSLAGVWALHHSFTAVPFVALFGFAAFATVPPLQLWVLQRTQVAESLASSLNIAAFNLGNALGAWLGGWALVSRAGLAAVPATAVLLSGLGLGLAVWACSGRRNEPHGALGTGPAF